MARTRSITPAAPLDEDVARLSLAARYVWAFLPCHADREGRMKDSAFTIKANIMPADNVDMGAVLAELASAGHVIRYEVAGKRYLQIRSFAKYQTPHVREIASVIPAPGEAQPRQCSDTTREMSSTPDPDPDPDPGPDQDPGPEDLAPRRADPSSPPATPIPSLEFPCDGSPKAWTVTRELVAQWLEAFPSLDIEAECRKALAWVRADKSRKKTAGGMQRFLVSWFSRSQNRGPTARGSPPASRSAGNVGNLSDWMARKKAAT